MYMWITLKKFEQGYKQTPESFNGMQANPAHFEQFYLLIATGTLPLPCPDPLPLRHLIHFYHFYHFGDFFF